LEKPFRQFQTKTLQSVLPAVLKPQSPHTRTISMNSRILVLLAGATAILVSALPNVNKFNPPFWTHPNVTNTSSQFVDDPQHSVYIVLNARDLASAWEGCKKWKHDIVCCTHGAHANGLMDHPDRCIDGA
jgi:hypothetical protein